MSSLTPYRILVRRVSNESKQLINISSIFVTIFTVLKSPLLFTTSVSLPLLTSCWYTSPLLLMRTWRWPFVGPIRPTLFTLRQTSLTSPTYTSPFFSLTAVLITSTTPIVSLLLHTILFVLFLITSSSLRERPFRTI